MTRSLLFTLCLVIPACTKAKETPDSPAKAADSASAKPTAAKGEAPKDEAKPTEAKH
ncbi:MAG: hypothetical protein AAF799_26215 [Myxococcota bacterium]